MQDNAAKCIRDYAVTRGNMRSSSPLAWLAYQAAMVLPMAAVLWLGGLIRGRRAQAPVVAAAGVRPAEAELRRYLIFLTSGPLLLTVMAALLHRTGAKLMWGVPMLNLAGLLLVSWLTPQVSAQGMRRLACVLLLLISAGAASFAAVTHLQPRFASQARFVRTSWPQHDIARRMRAIWTAETGAPLRIVTGDKGNWVSGLVALADGEPASVFTQANYELSPWITPARLAREGTLVVWEERGQGAPAALCPLIAGHPGGSERFPFAVTGKLVAVTIGYAVIAPTAAPLRNTP
jgi:hypothetical protein